MLFHTSIHTYEVCQTATCCQFLKMTEIVMNSHYESATISTQQTTGDLSRSADSNVGGKHVTCTRCYIPQTALDQKGFCGFLWLRLDMRWMKNKVNLTWSVRSICSASSAPTTQFYVFLIRVKSILSLQTDLIIII